MCLCFPLASQTVSSKATVHDKCSVKMEEALNLWVEYMNRNILIGGSWVWYYPWFQAPTGGLFGG